MCNWICFLVLLITVGKTYSSEHRDTKEMRHGKHLLSIIGYFQGFKVGQSYALQLAPFLFSSRIPISVLIPSVNLQQSVTIQKATSDESYQEIGGNVQKIMKLITNNTEMFNGGSSSTTTTSTGSPIENASVELDRNVETVHNFKRDTDTFEPIERLDDSETEKELIINATVQSELNVTDHLETMTTPSPHYQNIYPNALYNNSVENITLSANNSSIETNFTNVDKNTTTEPPKNYFVNMFKPIPNPLGVYPTSSYDNSNLDKLELTTPRHEGEDANLPPAEDETWKHFSLPFNPNDVNLNGFKPLAGLYYDGFLHVPLIKTQGFSPHYNNYL